MTKGYEKLTTYDFNCTHCGKNEMLPNRVGNFIKGWKCAKCDTVNYPNLYGMDTEEKLD